MTKEEKLELYKERVNLSRDTSLLKNKDLYSAFCTHWGVYQRVLIDYCNKRIEEIDKLLEL